MKLTRENVEAAIDNLEDYAMQCGAYDLMSPLDRDYLCLVKKVNKNRAVLHAVCAAYFSEKDAHVEIKTLKAENQ